MRTQFSHVEGDTVHMFTEKMDTVTLVINLGDDEQRKYVEELPQMQEKCPDGEEVVVTVLTAPMLLNEKDESVVQIIIAAKFQKASA